MFCARIIGSEEFYTSEKKERRERAGERGEKLVVHVLENVLVALGTWHLPQLKESETPAKCLMTKFGSRRGLEFEPRRWLRCVGHKSFLILQGICILLHVLN
ncbi:hypothetical protein L211DRAFT_435719 [Terfezia boudieri ATCC MYA-4762]|uniref:Uncharacterized protein n=1 Tax=Terfezia boudieri ATCC MYA-4762 TaxID=1051890 RepID=A0A3N4LTW6_9PEZI|nr:hypothetical protein L211DRAFT_435719 [Terfezia boudieri ATCC MYA-4762]